MEHFFFSFFAQVVHKFFRIIGVIVFCITATVRTVPNLLLSLVSKLSENLIHVNITVRISGLGMVQQKISFLFAITRILCKMLYFNFAIFGLFIAISSISLMHLQKITLKHNKNSNWYTTYIRLDWYQILNLHKTSLSIRWQKKSKQT